MKQRKDKERLADALQEIVCLYDRPEAAISHAYQDEEIDPLWPRFERAAINQIEDGERGDREPVCDLSEHRQGQHR